MQEDEEKEGQKQEPEEDHQESQGQDPQGQEREREQKQSKPRMSVKGQERDYKTRHQVQMLLAEMERQICEGKSDNEIMKFLEMKDRSFYYFKKKLYEQSFALQTAKKTEEVIAFETRILKERLVKIYQHLDERLTMLNRDPRPNDDIAEIALVTYQIARNIMTLEMEGLRALSSVHEKKFLKYANRYYNDISDYPNRNNGNDNGNTSILQPKP